MTVYNDHSISFKGITASVILPVLGATLVTILEPNLMLKKNWHHVLIASSIGVVASNFFYFIGSRVTGGPVLRSFLAPLGAGTIVLALNRYMLSGQSQVFWKVTILSSIAIGLSNPSAWQK